VTQAGRVDDFLVERGENLESMTPGIGESHRGEGLRRDIAIQPFDSIVFAESAQGIHNVGPGKAPLLDDLLRPLGLCVFHSGLLEALYAAMFCDCLTRYYFVGKDSGDMPLGPPQVCDRVLYRPATVADLFFPITIRGAL